MLSEAVRLFTVADAGAGSVSASHTAAQARRRASVDAAHDAKPAIAVRHVPRGARDPRNSHDAAQDEAALI
ncbi:MAG: Aerotaxis sensor receptor protein [uncultured Paraburkholderia sp.]|nr:MAG: Aerotaxis sensor receptor protein [uncultured Paraburkholderia sp.]